MEVMVIIRDAREHVADVNRVTVTDGRLQLVAMYGGREMVCCEFASGVWESWQVLTEEPPNPPE